MRISRLQAETCAHAWIPDQSPTGHHIGTHCVLDDDGEWRAWVCNRRIKVELGEHLYSTKASAVMAARNLWRAR